MIFGNISNLVAFHVYVNYTLRPTVQINYQFFLGVVFFIYIALIYVQTNIDCGLQSCENFSFVDGYQYIAEAYRVHLNFP
jgi:hypothetical protein